MTGALVSMAWCAWACTSPSTNDVSTVDGTDTARTDDSTDGPIGSDTSDAGGVCASDLDCSDHVFCNGADVAWVSTSSSRLPG